VSLLEVIAMDAPAASEVAGSFDAIWAEILSEKNVHVLNFANRILAGYTLPSDPSPGEPALMHWDASPRAYWANVVGDTGSLVLAIKDTAKFQVAEHVVRKILYYKGTTYAVVPHLKAKVALLCTKCYVWEHHVTICKAKNQFCELCSDAHPTSLHDEHCMECVAEAFILESTVAPLCPCTGAHLKCANCGETGHGPRSQDCRIFKQRSDAQFMKNFSPKIKQGTRVQNTRTKGGVTQVIAERDRLTKAREGTHEIIGVRSYTLRSTQDADPAYRIARWARPELYVEDRLVRPIPVYYCQTRSIYV
jgi:hypothetical protein